MSEPGENAAPEDRLRALETRVAELSEEARALEVLNRIGVAVAAERDLERIVQMVTDAGVEYTKAQFGAFFYNLIDAKGETYTLYTLSGVAREAFAKFPMPRNTPIFEPTFRGTGIVRSDDITKDPRYGKMGPYHGQPPGHLPVRSYLAVPVISRSGDVLGGLFFGHAEVGVFSDRAERILTAIAAQAGVAIDNARLNAVLERRAQDGAGQLRDSEARFRLLVEAVVDYAIFMLDPDGRVVNWNTGAERIKGYMSSEVVGTHISRFYTEPDREAGVPQRLLETAARTGRAEAEGWRVRKDGTRFWASVVIDAIRAPNGTLIGFAKITRDLTEKRDAEEQLRQANKMEAIGQLTGGVAHDFNNLLTVITGSIDTLIRRLPPTADDRLKRPANAALTASMKAAVLTHQLLAFARRQTLEPRPVSMNVLIGTVAEMLHRTLGEGVTVETVLGGGLWLAYVDANQLESALLNMGINARDAMPGGGTVTIESANVYLDGAYAGAADIPAGQYVCVSIADTGTGMSPEVISKAFDPFFTTKEVGQGTGLGLSQVYGFVKQSGGHIKIESEVDVGTILRLYLPRYHPAAGETTATLEPTATPPARRETILVVEDNPDVRAYTAEMLRDLGYPVIEAADGQQGLRQLDTHREIEVLFTDIGLPGGMNGRQLAGEAQRRKPDLKVLYTSGYAPSVVAHHGRLDPRVEMIAKPFTSASLDAKLRKMLGPA